MLARLLLSLILHATSHGHFVQHVWQLLAFFDQSVDFEEVFGSAGDWLICGQEWVLEQVSGRWPLVWVDFEHEKAEVLDRLFEI